MVKNMNDNYVHGYTEREASRLRDQAECLSDLLHSDTVFPKGSLILEAGCGTGAQTKIVAPKNPDSKFVSMDISVESLSKAAAMLKKEGIKNVSLLEGDINRLDFEDSAFDHILICFVLEHLPDPVAALLSVKRVLKKGGTVTVIEGDHGSAFFYPDSTYARKAIEAQVILQARKGGNALVGRQIYPLLESAGYKNCRVGTRTVYADPGRPEMVEGFTINTFTAMIEGIREEALKSSIIDENDFNKGIRDLYRTAGKDGVFVYTFFKGVGYI